MENQHYVCSLIEQRPHLKVEAEKFSEPHASLVYIVKAGQQLILELYGKKQSRGSSSIDYVIISKKCFARVQNIRVLRGTETSADQYLLGTGIIPLDGTTTRRQRSVKTRIKNQKLKKESAREEHRRVVEEKFSNGDRKEDKAQEDLDQI
ncbi:hypothetical protein ILUMI_07922 [Ignelater luminosus]|uniref:Uncharacterized protein n=1 Tax=Ignelater luminosus TaxID=2038154 RepID=A0A8K0D7B4_IGNLU|nr:hypothetical protein ILUMI_07922 [Ignelater luminosus]